MTDSGHDLPLVDEPHRFPVVAEEQRFSGAKWSVWSETVDIDGHVVVRDVLRHPGAVAVAAVDDEGRLLLIRQYRHPVAAYMWEIPAGLLDVEGEDALTCATRELFEETGYRHGTIEFMGGCYLSPGFTDEYMHLFWARTRSEPEAEPEDGIELVRMPYARAIAAAREGRIRNVSTALALLMAAARVPAP